MTYFELKDFIERNPIKQVFQPVMLLYLLKSQGECSEDEIAKAILANVYRKKYKYYMERTRNMVGKVLQRHGIVKRKGTTYRLVGYDYLSKDQINSLVNKCEEKLEKYLSSQGKNIVPSVSEEKDYDRIAELERRIEELERLLKRK